MKQLQPVKMSFFNTQQTVLLFSRKSACAVGRTQMNLFHLGFFYRAALKMFALEVWLPIVASWELFTIQPLFCSSH